MSENESLGKESEKQCGVILGFWDQEKTLALIEDLEHSVNVIEAKCRKLLEQLIYYKKYLEELNNPHSVKFFLTLKGKRSKNEKKCLLSGSDPDITSRKCQIKFQEVEEIFEKNFERELLTINQQLSYASEKIGLKETGFLFPTDDYVNTLNETAANKVRGSLYDVREVLTKKHHAKPSAKSESKIPHVALEFSKITRNELELYQKLSKLNFRRRWRWVRGLRKEKKVSGTAGKRVSLKLRFKKGGQGGAAKGSKVGKEVAKGKPISRKQNKKVRFAKKIRLRITKKSRFFKPQSRPKTPEASEMPKKLQNNRLETHSSSSVDTREKSVSFKTFGKAEDVSDLASFARKAVPFTPCSSTSKSFNIGMNIQQFLSETKYFKPGSAGARESRQELPSAGQEFAATYPWDHRVEEKEKVWIAKSPERKCRSKFTRSSSGSFLEYHKSTTRQFTNGEKSFIKSESKRAYAVGSRIMVSGCETTDYFQIDDKGSFFQNDSGYEFCHEHSSKLSTEWTKVYAAFVHISRKYGQLKKQMENMDTASPEAELETLGNEIDGAINKYKEFLKFYSKFLHLRDRLKSLKMACEAKTLSPVTSFSCNSRRWKAGSCRPTYSMAMKEAFRHVQTLHDKIRLVSDI